MDFSGTDIQSIEETLEQHRPAGWRRLDASTLEPYSYLMVRAGWSLKVQKGQFGCETVDRLVLLIDHAFPKSEVRVVVPSLKLGDWPHVEKDGLLCLRRTAWSASAGDRAISSVADACDLLNFDEARRKSEFSREFSAYWTQLLAQAQAGPLFTTLVIPEARSREICFARYRDGNRIMLGDDRDAIARWLEHRGDAVDRRDIRKTLLVWLKQPWTPEEFPRRRQDVLEQVDRYALNTFLRPGESLPVLFGATTDSGPVFVGIDMPSPDNSRKAQKQKPLSW